MTLIEEQLDALVRRLGFATEGEVPFPPYRVDVYSHELHVAFEADGPMHSGPRDARRDAELLESYGLIVYRVPHKRLRSADTRALVLEDMRSKVDEWALTVEERKANATQAQDH